MSIRYLAPLFGVCLALGGCDGGPSGGTSNGGSGGTGTGDTGGTSTDGTSTGGTGGTATGGTSTGGTATGGTSTGGTSTGGAGGAGGMSTGGAGGAGGMGNGGAGGSSMNCVTCAEYITPGGNPNGFPTCAGTSTDLYDALVDCTCNGNCMPDCGDNVCLGADISMACQNCVVDTGIGCGNEFNECANDI